MRFSNGSQLLLSLPFLLLALVLCSNGAHILRKEAADDRSKVDLRKSKKDLLKIPRQSIVGNSTTAHRVGPCKCSEGICGCCSRILLDSFNQKACVNVTYDPDEFSFTANILMNDRILYTRTVSGRWNFSLSFRPLEEDLLIGARGRNLFGLKEKI